MEGFVAENSRELARLRALVERLSDDELRRKVNEDWTVAGVLGHIAFWDARALFLADRLVRGAAFTESEREPDDPAWINDSTRPLIHAIAPREAARTALGIAEETDRVMASLTAEQVRRTFPSDQRSPCNPLRADHRGEHLDEIEATLRR